jgi:hypothetical protein
MNDVLMELAERIEAKSIPEPNTGCWLWTGALGSDGYGHIRLTLRPGASRMVGAHRASFMAFNGAIPDGLVVDHRCTNPPCVNPAHLRAITKRMNTLIGRAPSARHASATQCTRGHVFDEANTRIDYDAKGRRERVCRACDRIRHAAAKARAT